MAASDRESRLRLTLAFVCYIALGFLYVQALAGAAIFGTYSSFVHPWDKIDRDILIFALCGACFVLLAEFRRSGSRLQRVAAVLLAALPVLVIARFIFWLLR